MDWDEIASTWDERDEVRSYAAAAYQSLEQQCELIGFALAGARACDYGCGTGLLSEYLAKHCSAVVAVDRSPQMIAALRTKVADRGLERVVPIVADLTPELIGDHQDFQAPFDLVTCSSVCAFVDDYPQTVKLLAGCLRPGGLFVQWDWELDPAADEPFGLTRDSIRSALTAADLEPVYIDTGFRITQEDHQMAPLMGIGCKQ
jgi:2-polyprenyl-3-methyl-5-hydroxy-6-metoxy-1,4-benzoquinol methylase